MDLNFIDLNFIDSKYRESHIACRTLRFVSIVGGFIAPLINFLVSSFGYFEIVSCIFPSLFFFLY